MASKKVTIKGRGPELFGRGIDLLFGDAADDAQEPDPGFAIETHHAVAPETMTGQAVYTAREEAYLDTLPASQPVSTPVDEYLRLAAEAFFNAQTALPPFNGAASHAPPQSDGPVWQTPDLTASEDAFIAPADAVHEEPVAEPPADAFVVELPALEETPATPLPDDSEGTTMPTPNSNAPIDTAASSQEAAELESTQSRKVGVPGGNGRSGADDSALKADLILRELTALTEQEKQEILDKLRRSDLNALDREADALYEKSATLLAGKREEATVAFDILRRVRLILLKDPEHYADAEYLVHQVRARINQIEQSLEAGRRYGPRLFAYQTVWMVLLAVLALVTTVNGASFAAWVAYLLGVQVDSEQLNWAILFMSTLAWGGIGGVTGALWSLYQHISIDRDFDPVENLWYYSQPVLGMVLGGIVFLIMGAGFLVVQVPMGGATETALGPRLLPAAIAVVAGFRQNMVLDLIERLIAVILPSQEEEKPGLQNSYQQPSEEPMI